jgi:hypothetical protein
MVSRVGIYFGRESNATIFRRLFDVLMKVNPIWREEAGEQALVSKRDTADWLRGLAGSFSCRSSVFLPPHLFDLPGRHRAGAVLAAPDGVLPLIPRLRDQGDGIMFEVQE